MLIALSCLTVLLSTSVDALRLSAPTGAAPLHVRVTGPDRLVSRGGNTFSKWVGCGYSVDWGDGAAMPPRDCQAGLEHVFASPGRYKVKASTFHPNPDDSQSTDWTGEAEVVVR